MTRKGLRACTWLTVLALLGGCAPFQPVKTETWNTYVLQAPPASASKPRTGSMMLLVSPPRAEPGFDTPRMAYVKEHYRIDYYARNRWADTPAHMLAPLMVQAIEHAGGFRGVVQGPSAARADLRLDTEVIRLQQEFLNPPSRIRFTLRAQLIQVANRQVLATRVFDVTEEAPSGDPYGGVVAANRAVARVLSALAEFCADSGRGLASGQGAGGDAG
jgi:cholesterol transport system auxiliary component